jgi:hypothetical protein
MADTGWVLCTVTTGSSGWTSPNNILADDSVRASVNLSAGASSGILIGLAPGMSSIPSGATINGIEWRVKTFSARAGTYFVQNRSAGAAVGSSKNISTGINAQTLTFGGVADLWSWAATDTLLKSSSYGFGLTARNDDAKFSGDLRVDVAHVRVTYTPAASPPTITSITPDNVPAGGGTTVTINGTNLASGTVTVGGTSPFTTTVVSSSKITIVTSHKTEGLYDVDVTTSGGTATKTNGLKFLGTVTGGYQRNRVRETANVTTTGNIFLTGAYSAAYRTFISQIPSGSTIKYMVINSNGEYEVGVGKYYDSSNYISRDSIEESSNSNAIVSFSAGTKEVILCETAGASAFSAEYRNVFENASLTFWQRQTPGTAKSLADGEYGPDRWYVLTQTANIEASRLDGNRPHLWQAYSANLKQINATAQRFGIAQRVWSHESLGLRGKLCRLQANIYSNTNMRVNWAVLEWTGTSDSVTRDPVLSWTSTTFTPGNFFLASNYTVIGVGNVTTPTGGGTVDIAENMTTPFSYSLNNVVVLFWTHSTAAQNDSFVLSTPMLIDDIYPRQWKKPNWATELVQVQASYCKTFGIDTAPVQNIGNGQGALRETGNGSGVDKDWRFPVNMRKVPTITTFNTSAANSSWRDTTASADRAATAGTPTSGGVAINAASTVSGNQMSIHATADADQ